MNCANHVDVPATAFCRTCGKPLCSSCARDVRGVIYCEECLASHLTGAVPPPGTTVIPPVVEPSGVPKPGLAALLGLIPGVGAMYNGEYAKGFVHVLIFATLIWMGDHVSDVFGIVIAAFYVYMPIEAYRTAKAHAAGLPAPDPFGFNNVFRSSPPPAAPVANATAYTAPLAEGAHVVPEQREPMAEPASRVPVGAVILIGLGVLFLLDQFGALHFDWIWRFWPVILIAIGIRILMRRRGAGW